MLEKSSGKDQIKNYTTERNCIAGILKYPEILFELETFLTEHDFYHSDYAKLYSLLKHLVIDKQIEKFDYAIILSTISNLEYTFSPQINITDMLQKLMEESRGFELKNIKEIAKEVFYYSKRREMWECGGKIQSKMMENNYNSIQSIISTSDTVYFDSVNQFVIEDDIKPMGEGIMEKIDKRADNPVEHIGFSSGFDIWHRKIGFFEPDTLTFVAARAKAGKSMFGLNVGVHVARFERIPVLYLDSELDNEKMGYRLASHISGIPEYYVKTGNWKSNKEYCQKLDKARTIINDFNALPLQYYSTRGLGIESILSICRRFLSKIVKRNGEGIFNPCLIIYDYIKIDYNSVSGGEWSLNVGKTVNDFKNFLGDTKASGLMLGQTNRTGITKTDSKTNEKYNIDTEESIGLSDEIAKTCSSASILRYKTEKEKNEDGVENGNMLILPLFSRDGIGGQDIMLSEGVYGKDYINFNRDGAKMTFHELSTRSSVLKSKSIGGFLK